MYIFNAQFKIYCKKVYRTHFVLAEGDYFLCFERLICLQLLQPYELQHARLP